MNKYPIKKLSEIIVLNYGKAVDKSDKSDEGLYDVYGANGVMYKSKKFNFEGESIIIGRKGSAGAINRVRGKLWASDVTYYVTTDQNVDYICYTLKKLNLPELAKGVKPGINRNDVYEIQIPLPPLSTQSRIVARLDAAFASIDEQITLIRSNIADVENTRKSALRKVFRDSIFEMKRIDSLALIMSAGGTPSRNESEFWGGNIPWYSSGELNDLYTKDSREFITKKGLESSSAKLFPRGTLLIGMYDTAAMKMSVLDREGSCNQAVVGFFPKEEIVDVFYTKYYLTEIKEKVLEGRQGVRQKNLNLSKLKEIQIPLPPLPRQHEIVAHLDEVFEMTRALRAEYEAQIRDLEILKQSLLEEAFAGRLVGEKNEA